MCRALLIAMVFGLTLAVVPCFAEGDAISDAPDLDIGTVVSEGKDLTTQAQAADNAQKALASDSGKIQAEKATTTKDWSAYTQTATDFNSRCNHPFVEGQESEVAACQTDNDGILKIYAHLKEQQVSIQKRLDDWNARKAKVDQQQADIALRLESWKHRMKALLVAKGMSDCSNAVGASAGSSNSYAELQRLVSGYQHCWDGASSAQAPPGSGATQGSPVFSAGTSRTPQQAIADYKKSGNADPGVSQKRGLDQISVPPPATGAQP
jgi:hypothetical protein